MNVRIKIKTNKKSFAVIGLGRFGGSLVKSLLDLRCEVLGIDISAEQVATFSECMEHVIQADTTNEIAFRELGLENFDTVIVSIGNDEHASVLTTMLAKEVGVKNIIAKANSEIHGKILQRIGASKVIFPEKEMGERTAHLLASQKMLDYMDLGNGLGIVELHAPKIFLDKKIKDINPRSVYGSTIIAIQRGSELITIPGYDEVVKKDDIIIIIGNQTSNEKIKNLG